MKSLGVEIVIMLDKHNPISTCSLASGQLSAQHYLSRLLHQEEEGKGQDEREGEGGEEGEGGGRGGEEGGGGRGRRKEGRREGERGGGKRGRKKKKRKKRKGRKEGGREAGREEGGSQTRSQDKRSSTPPNLPATPMLLAHLLKPMLLLQAALSSLWGTAQYWLQPYLLLTH